jgi:hypothetical protein
VLEFIADTHTYKKDGVVIPSVTQIIGEWQLTEVYGVEYYYNIYSGAVLAADRFTEARDFGRAAHAMNALYLMGSLDQSALHPSLIPVLDQFDTWLRTFNVEPVLIETPLYSEKHQYAGTPDLVCLVKKRLAIVDYKTGDYAMAGPQLAGYDQLYKPKIYKQRFVLYLPKDGGQFKFVPCTNYSDDWKFFYSRLCQYHYLKGLK